MGRGTPITEASVRPSALPRDLLLTPKATQQDLCPGPPYTPRQRHPSRILS